MNGGRTAFVYPWRGQAYEGLRAVARAAGVTHQTVSYHLDRYGNLDRLGSGVRAPNPAGGIAVSRPVNKFGRSWPSVTALACEIGHPRPTVRRWLANDDDRLLAALMAADARRTASALKGADMIDTIRKAAA